MVFLNWPRVQLDLPLMRRKASHRGVHAQISSEADLLTDASTHSSSSTENMVRIPGGTFSMGSDGHYPEEAPVHRVTVSDFWIDADAPKACCVPENPRGGSEIDSYDPR